jgi:hypothetical protein
MVSESERADFKRGLRDRKQRKKIAPVPESDAYYKGLLGEPLEESKHLKRAWGIALAVALPISILSYRALRPRTS